ncbi:MAG: type II secretion system protein GspJ [Thermodesulfobacteriota bacterium]
MKAAAGIADCRKLHRGFTLLEILIAISIFGVIATIVYSTFNAVVSRTDVIKEEAAVSEMAATCLNRITMDLKAMYVEQYPLYKPADYDDEPDPYRFEAELDYTGSKQFPRLSFASGEHLPMSGDRRDLSADNKTMRPGLARIRYHVDKGQNSDPDSDQGHSLKRGDRPFPYDDSGPEDNDPEKDPVLCRNITELEFTYLDSQGDWHETWDSESENIDYATPRAVKIALKISTGGREHRFSTSIDLPVYREPLERVEQ